MQGGGGTALLTQQVRQAVGPVGRATAGPQNGSGSYSMRNRHSMTKSHLWQMNVPSETFALDWATSMWYAAVIELATGFLTSGISAPTGITGHGITVGTFDDILTSTCWRILQSCKIYWSAKLCGIHHRLVAATLWVNFKIRLSSVHSRVFHLNRLR